MWTTLWNSLCIILYLDEFNSHHFSIPFTPSRHCCAVSVKFHNRFSWQSFQMETMNPFVESLVFIIITKMERHWQNSQRNTSTKMKTKYFSANTIQMANETQCRHKFDLTDASINRNCCQFISSFTVCICYILVQQFSSSQTCRNIENVSGEQHTNIVTHALTLSFAYSLAQTQRHTIKDKQTSWCTFRWHRTKGKLCDESKKFLPKRK